MHLLVVGLSYKTTPLEIREQFSFITSTLDNPTECPPSLQAQFKQNGSTDKNIQESCVLSTCNRLEYYAVVQNPTTALAEIIARFSQTCHISASAFQSYLYHHQDEAMVKHLMRVATGLDSMVLGEAQILGQVVKAYQDALSRLTIGSTLARLFETAIRAGKRARKETKIGQNPTSISSIALRLAQSQVGDLAECVTLVLGAGEMGHLTVQNLVSQGVKKLLIANRTYERAVELAAQWGAETLPFAQLEHGLAQASLVITSTGAAEPILQPEQVRRAMQNRPNQPLVIIDIAVPRDVAPEVDQLAGVHLYNIDHLQTQLADNLKARQQEVPLVEAIIADEAAGYMNWRRSLQAVPTITHLRGQFEHTRQRELERALNRLGDLAEREQEIIAELSYRLMNKFLHHPTVRLREQSAQGNGELFASVAKELFALEENPL